MPGVQGDYFTRLQAETEAASKPESASGWPQRRRDELHSASCGASSPVLTTPANPPGSTPGIASTANTQATTRPIAFAKRESRLDRAAAAVSRSDHPDVNAPALRRRLSTTSQARQQSEIDAVAVAIRVQPRGLGCGEPRVPEHSAAVQPVEVEIAALRAEFADRQRKIADLRRLLNTAPEIEAEARPPESRLRRDPRPVPGSRGAPRAHPHRRRPRKRPASCISGSDRSAVCGLCPHVTEPAEARWPW